MASDLQRRKEAVARPERARVRESQSRGSTRAIADSGLSLLVITLLLTLMQVKVQLITRPDARDTYNDLEMV